MLSCFVFVFCFLNLKTKKIPNKSYSRNDFATVWSRRHPGGYAEMQGKEGGREEIWEVERRDWACKERGAAF